MNRLRFGLNKVKNTNISWQYIRFVCVIYYTCASKDKWPLIRIDIFSLSTPKKNGFLLPVLFFLLGLFATTQKGIRFDSMRAFYFHHSDKIWWDLEEKSRYASLHKTFDA